VHDLFFHTKAQWIIEEFELSVDFSLILMYMYIYIYKTYTNIGTQFLFTTVSKQLPFSVVSSNHTHVRAPGHSRSVTSFHFSYMPTDRYLQFYMFSF
jgi:hypothetical protein